MRKRKFSAKVLSGALAAAMAVSMLPAVPALAVTGSQVAADGTYTSLSHDVISNDEDWEEDYAVTVSLTVEDGVFSDITVTPNESYDSDVNGTYFEKAYSKTKGIKTLLEGQPATEDTVNGWDTVSNATITSTAVKEAALEAIGSAAEAAEEYVYVTMNIPYDDFVNAVDADAEQAAEYTDALDGVDVVSYATSKYGLSTDDEDNPVGKRSTSGTAKGTYNDGTSVRGVYYAVQMTESTYEELAGSALTEGDDYYFTDLEEEPDSFLVLTYADGVYTFDASGLTTALTEEAEIADLTYTSTYGDYMFSLMNVEQNGIKDADGNSDIQIDGESVTIAVEILKFSDGSTYVMYNVDNIWMGSRYDHEISWSVVGGKEYHKGHNDSDNPLYYQYTMTDYTLTGVQVFTDKGIYNFTCEETLLPYYSGDEEFSATAEDGDTEVSVSVPSVLEDVAVSVSYSTGSGRNVTTVYVAEAAAVADGKVTLTEAIDQETNGSYTILIESSNYAPKTVTLEAPMTEAQAAELETLAAEGNALLTVVDHSLLAEHVEEAEELLANTAATSSEAAELIEELTAYIEEAKALAVSALETLAADAEALNESDYTEESWAVLQTALAAANEALDSEDAADVVVDVYTDLKSAVDALERVYVAGDTLLVRRGNKFYVSYDLESGDADLVFTFGKETDEVLIGDWDGDGIDTICVRRGKRYYFSNTLGEQAEFYIDYGRESDGVIAGDWDGDGYDTLCVRRGIRCYISNTLESGDAEQVFTFGRENDEVLAGDWDGDGYDTLCIRRDTRFYINNVLEGGNAEINFTFGRIGDTVTVGDWNGDGNDTLCICRENRCYINNTLEGGDAAQVFTYGRSSDELYAGIWQ